MKQLRLLIILLMLPAEGILMAQDVKNEVEVSIRQHQMPQQAIQLLGPILAEAGRVKFYQETDGEQTSFESKLSWKGNFYSIEFDHEGKLLDVEKLVSFRTLPKEIRKQVEEQLESEFDRYRIRRTQVQYSAGKNGQPVTGVIRKFMENDAGEMTIRYEIEADGRKGNQIGGYELLFDQEGKLLKKRPVVRRSLDNILY